jgi:Pyridoxamine 5'-phosphate oxidase
MAQPRADRPVMPGYGVASGRTGLLRWPWALERLRDAHNYWLATRSAGGAPHLAAVWAVWHADTLCFSTGARSRKAADLAAEPRCSLAPEGAAESVVLTGVARRVTDPAGIAAIERAYAAKYGSGFPDPTGDPLYSVAPDTVVAVIEGEPDFTARATRWRFH